MRVHSLLSLSLGAFTLCSSAAAQCEFQKISNPTSNPGFASDVAVGRSFQLIGHESLNEARAYRLVNGAWQETSVLQPFGTSTAENFGVSVAIDETLAGNGSMAIVGSRGDDQDVGAAYLFRATTGSFQNDQRLTASDGLVGDGFGVAVDVLGTVAVVSAPGKEVGGLGSAGQVYVFESQAGTWIETAILTAPTPTISARFGTSVSVGSGAIVVGAPFAPDANGNLVGKAFRFEKNGSGNWVVEEEYEGEGVGDSFGSSVSIWGTWTAVGAPLADVGAFTNQGAVYLFQGGVQQQRLTSSVAQDFEDFGRAVCLSRDLNGSGLAGTLLVGAPQRDVQGVGDAGCFYVFEDTGTTWLQQALVEASDPAIGVRLGQDVDAFEETYLVAGPGAGGAAYAYFWGLLEGRSDFRNGGTNPNSYVADPPVLGQVWSLTIDLTTTGSDTAYLLVRTQPANITLPQGVLLVAPRGPVPFSVPPLPGPIATFSMAIPNDPTLCGATAYTQALHENADLSVILGNAQDLRIGLY